MGQEKRQLNKSDDGGKGVAYRYVPAFIPVYMPAHTGIQTDTYTGIHAGLHIGTQTGILSLSLISSA